MAKVLPTLNINQPIIDDPSQIAVSLLKFAFWNPGSTSSYLEHMLISMRKLRASTGQDITKFPNALQYQLDAAIKRYNDRYTASVTSERLSPTTYKLVISIRDTAGVPLINIDDIVIDDGEIKLKSDLKEIERYE